ncbi:MAG TPA: hypothetical protein VFE78_39030, partial [Gemmataceae bacterium]|nr:hypothetical protein [Gemmataceae bacterium]
PDKYGLYLDHFDGDPLGYYPVSDADRKAYPESYPAPKGEAVGKYPLRYSRKEENKPRQYRGAEDLRHYGRPTGVVGLRLFDNPAFDEAARKKWDVGQYFKNPGKVEPPYLVGFSCAFCHIAFAPNNPPADPENPRWENLAANLGNQYFREGELMFGKGRLLFGDKHPDPAAPGDPYATRGLTEDDFLYHYAATQQPGTSETSRISYDFINNPNTINPIFGLAYRPTFTETTPWGTRRVKKVMRVLKDGSDSVGLEWALMRVPINIGCEGDYWLDHLFDPASGRRQRPFRIAEVLGGPYLSEKELNGLRPGLSEEERNDVRAAGGPPLDAEDQVPPAPPDATDEDKAARDAKVRARQAQLKARQAELRRRYRSPYGREQFGQDWQDAWRRVPSLAAYLSSYKPFRLADTEAGKAALSKDEATLRRGAKAFGEHCARCHSSKQPDNATTPRQRAKYFRGKSTGAWADVQAFYLKENFLSDDERYPVTELGTNMARALATNAVDGDIWAELSSKNYKALRPLGPLTLDVPVFPPDPRLPWSLTRPIRVEFDPLGGGRGYYRTPSLISVWATAPYLHNNSVGDYWVIKDGKSVRFPNTGAQVGGRLPDGSWVNYRIDTSVEGRLAMFKDGMQKLLNPSRRHGWVKRTSAPSTLIPDLAGSARQLVAGVARDTLRRELSTWLSQNQFTPAQIELALGAVGPSLDRAVGDVLTDGGASLRFAWAAVHVRVRDHADRLFELTFDDLKGALEGKLGDKTLPLDRLKLSVRREFLARLDKLDRDLRGAAMLKVPAGTPVNLYANLNPNALAHAALAHMRLRDDPRALAEALLRLSDCPDLVEDSGHRYGEDLPPEDKDALIEFLKTF